MKTRVSGSSVNNNLNLHYLKWTFSH